MGTRVPKLGQIRLRLDSAEGYEASIIVPDDDPGFEAVTNWLGCQLSLLATLGAKTIHEVVPT